MLLRYSQLTAAGKSWDTSADHVLLRYSQQLLTAAGKSWDAPADHVLLRYSQLTAAGKSWMTNYCHFNNAVFIVAAITLEYNLPGVRMWERSNRGSSYIKEHKIRVILILWT